ncbi:NAD-dependent epimerase [Methylobacillus flagellatus]|uniref:NAD-dependent epimerase n=1 Tax=Methylobacillus flagellatus TaxID=405 RepID=UPI0010F97025|nr:NAD-dependent epimerase [Methylobacillus flagellatus]
MSATLTGKRVLVTGAAGFIGFHLVQYLLGRGDQVVGVDNLNDYYDVNLKLARLADIHARPDAAAFEFIKLDLADRTMTAALFEQQHFDAVVHLAAQAGVRYSITNPQAYIDSNLVAFANVLEGCRHHQMAHLVYASSSSVYGGNTKLPFSEVDGVDHPVSLYAATKKANELMAHTYSHLYRLPTTGLRFFTVYGPWGRPDMSPFLFADAILNEKTLNVFNHGDMMRDFTYVDDIVESLVRVMDKPAQPDPLFDAAYPDPARSHAPYRVFNIGNSQPEPLMGFIETLEAAFGKVAQKIYLPMQAGDVQRTAADTSTLEQWIDFKPQTPLADGIARFADWYRTYYGY